jgi:N-sulfoglucosamine sulfohydrolase
MALPQGPATLVGAMQARQPRSFVSPLQFGVLLVLVLACFLPCAALASERPNILWITCEDTSPLLGCYGDPHAITPNIDALARQSVRYTQALAYTGVCAPSRSTIITGVNALRLGSHQMRSTTRLPDSVKCFSEYLRDSGYYCSNNSKTDYNFAVPRNAWDMSNAKAHWRNRKPGQPFFAVFNFNVTHESRIFCSDDQYAQNTRRLSANQRRDPAKIPIPPIHPDTPEFRKEWARHYDNVTAMDYQVGDLLAELEADGLADNTIVFFFSDHGTGLPAIKMFAWDASLRVPLLVHFPERWKHLAPGKPGTTSERLVTFVDFAPTVLSLVDVRIPSHMQGVAFLGKQAGPARQWVFGGKDRQGERYDTIRYVHDGRFHYLRNFQPHLPWGQRLGYLQNHASMHAWQQLWDAGKLNGPAARFFQLKPVEELYDVQADPWATNNLASDPRFQKQLKRLRAECLAQMKRTADLGLLPENEMHARSRLTTPYDIATDKKLNPLNELLAAAETANAMKAKNIPRLVQLLSHRDSAVRWWGATGLVALGDKAAPASDALKKAANDESPDVRVAVAEALANIGNEAEAFRLYRDALDSPSVFVRLAALNSVDRLGLRARPLIAEIGAAGGLTDSSHEYVSSTLKPFSARIADTLSPAD